MSPKGGLTAADYEALAQFRAEIRRFLRFSEQAARTAGLEPQQHQLLLLLKGLPEGVQPRIGEVAERLQIQHHSAVELVDRMVRRGMLKRHRGGSDRREVLVELTPRGAKVLEGLAVLHREELRSAGPTLVAALQTLMSRVRRSSTTRAKGRTRSIERG